MLLPCGRGTCTSNRSTHSLWNVHVGHLCQTLVTLSVMYLLVRRCSFRVDKDVALCLFSGLARLVYAATVATVAVAYPNFCIIVDYNRGGGRYRPGGTRTCHTYFPPLTVTVVPVLSALTLTILAPLAIMLHLLVLCHTVTVFLSLCSGPVQLMDNVHWSYPFYLAATRYHNNEQVVVAALHVRAIL